MYRGKRAVYSALLAVILTVSLFCVSGGLWVFAANQVGVVTTQTDPLRVRASAPSGAVVGYVPKGEEVQILETVNTASGIWYKIQYGSLTGYASGTYITLKAVDTPYNPDADFEKYLSAQKFPESYKAGLRALHAKYPNWVFVAKHLNLDWTTALNAESKVGKSLVLDGSGGARNSWKSMEYGAYNWDTKKYVVFDSGGWVTAQREVVAYYMDPRNFFDDTAIFQFEGLSYSANHTAAGVNNIIGGTFMKGYTDIFMKVAKEQGVSVLHLAARASQEQGVSGNALGTGYTIDGVKYYNFFNIGAYAANGKSAIENGAIYAKGRGWDTPEKALAGGAYQIAAGYIKMGQDTLYLQKFDVVDGGNGYYNHQYMSNVTAAKAESSKMKKAYSDETLKGTMVFNIPVYLNMPTAVCKAPQTNGNNDNTLVGITVNGYSLTPTFTRYTTDYSVTVPATVTNVNITANKSDSGASVAGAGNIRLNGVETTVKLVVTAPSGLTRTYTVHILRPGADGAPVIGNTPFTISTTITGITPATSAANLVKQLPVSNGTVRVVDSKGAQVNGNVGTGHTVQILSGSAVYASYPVIVYGDTSGDGVVSSKDLLLTQKHVLQINKMSGVHLLAADSNKDGKVTSADLLRTQKQILGISSVVK